MYVNKLLSAPSQQLLMQRPHKSSNKWEPPMYSVHCKISENVGKRRHQSLNRNICHCPAIRVIENNFCFKIASAWRQQNLNKILKFTCIQIRINYSQSTVQWACLSDEYLNAYYFQCSRTICKFMNITDSAFHSYFALLIVGYL